MTTLSSRHATACARKRGRSAAASLAGSGVGIAAGVVSLAVALACTHKRGDDPGGATQPVSDALETPSREPAETEGDASSGAAGSIDPPGPLSDREGVEQRYPDFEDAAFRADVDGDGKSEEITWTCAPAYTLRVGKRKATGRASITELQWCAVASFALDAAGRVPGVVLCLADHDEVGPGQCMIFRVHADRLEALWQGSARVDFYADGVITSASSRCSESDDAVIETIEVLRFDGASYDVTTHEVHSPLDGAGCIEP